MQDCLVEYKDELPEAMQVPEAPLPAAESPLIIEDLDSGDIQEHPTAPSVPPELHNMGEECQQAIAQAAKKRRSKGVKRVLSLHAAIMNKKAKGQWVGSDNPVPNLSLDQKSWMDQRVQKAIQSAPWRRQ